MATSPGIIKSVAACVITGLSAITSLFKTAENLASTAEAHSAKYKATALTELAAASEELDKA